MRASQFFFVTSRNVPSDAEIVSHQLMVRAGYIRKVTSGVYSWLPMGWRVVKKIESIVREEMNRAGAIELSMPALQPAELWMASKRWDKYGPELMRLKDRHQRDFCLGPTHEEVITTLAANDIHSYKQLPINLYQIQTKFRDEVRPRFGVMRGREFIMKDAYSFHADFACLEKTYQAMYTAYSRMFTRMGLKFRAVSADTGAIGGNHSHEFQVLADAGEDQIAFCPQSDFAANIELCALLPNTDNRPTPREELRAMSTPAITDCASVAKLLGVSTMRVIKTLIMHTAEDEVVMVLLRADHEINPVKLRKVLKTEEVHLASEETAEKIMGLKVGFYGPVNAPRSIKVFADWSVKGLSDAVCGANMVDQHFVGVNLGRDCPEPIYADIRLAQEGDDSPDGHGKISLCRGIEVGHIFQLRTKYSQEMGANFQNAEGVQAPFEMGCYGIGITRIAAAAIEQTAIKNQGETKKMGMTLPLPIAPFHVYMAPIGADKSADVKTACEALYQSWTQEGIEVYYDDRGERAGVMFADHELSGIPIRVVVSDKLLQQGQLEVHYRRAEEETAPLLIPQNEALAQVKAWLSLAMNI